MDPHEENSTPAQAAQEKSGWTTRRSAAEPVVAQGGRDGRIARVLLAVVVLVAIALAGLLGYGRYALQRSARQSLPQVDGRLAVAGLAGPVTVARDAQGVPHLAAGSLDDLVYAQAYVTAGDRLFQMDVLRRYAAGELAEVLGANLAAHDKLQRVLLLRRSAENALAALPADQRHLLDVYAGGVNAAMTAAEADGRLPVEFTALHYLPAAWRPVDSMLVAVAMMTDLTTSYPTKLARESLTRKLPPELVDDLYPVGSWRDHPPASAVPDLTLEGPPIEQVPLDESQSSLHAPVPARAPYAETCAECWPGSNNWAVAGSHTASGKPLLANDMHLAHNLPGAWYEVGLKAPLPGTEEPLDVAGVSLPGVPLVVVGHNRHVAWGFTVLGADVQDVYQETLRGTGSRQEFQTVTGSWAPVVHLAETVKVRGGRDIALDVTATRHGDAITPILNQALDPALVGGRTLALRWTLYDPHVLALPVLAIDTAHDWTSFQAGFASFGGPGQNVVYADDQGHIGYHAVGFVPLRGPAVDRAGSAAAELPSTIQTPVPVESANQTPVQPSHPSPLAATAIAGPPAPKTPLLSGPLSELPLVPDAAHEWSGYIPFDRMPQVFDPPAGFVATANGRTAPDDYPYPITLNWASPYRTDRIYHALAHRTGLTAQDMLALQNDVSSDFDRVLAQRLAYAIDHAPGMASGHWTGPEQARLRQSADLLRSFDGRMTTDSAAAAVVYSVHQVLWPMLLGLKLGVDEAQINSLYLWGERDYALEQLLAHLPPRWLSAPYTDWDDLLAASVLHGLDQAGAPRDLAGWRYGQTHVVDLEHPVFGQFPLLARLLGMPTGTGPQPQSGDLTTVKQVARTFGPSERFTTDFADLDRSTLNLPAGESGDPASAHFLDQFAHWLRGTTYPLPFSDAAVRKAAVHTLTLTPR